MNVYADTSFLVPLFVREEVTPAARRRMARSTKPLVISSWTLTEFAGALATKTRLGALSDGQVQAAHNRLAQAVAAGVFIEESVTRADFAQAALLLDPNGPPLRAGDALHLAICQRLGHRMSTFDAAMAVAATAAGIELVTA